MLASISLVAAVLILGTIAPSYAQNANKPTGLILMACENALGSANITFRDDMGNTDGQNSSCNDISKRFAHTYELSDSSVSVDFVDVQLHIRDFDRTILHTCTFFDQKHSNGNQYTCEFGDRSVTAKVIAH